MNMKVSGEANECKQLNKQDFQRPCEVHNVFGLHIMQDKHR